MAGVSAFDASQGIVIAGELIITKYVNVPANITFTFPIIGLWSAASRMKMFLDPSEDYQGF